MHLSLARMRSHPCYYHLGAIRTEALCGGVAGDTRTAEHEARKKRLESSRRRFQESIVSLKELGSSKTTLRQVFSNTKFAEGKFNIDSGRVVCQEIDRFVDNFAPAAHF